MNKLLIAVATLVAFSATAAFATTEAVKTPAMQAALTDAKAPPAHKVAKVEKKHVAHAKHHVKQAA